MLINVVYAVVYLQIKELILVLCKYETVDVGDGQKKKKRKGKRRGRRRVHGVGVNTTNLYQGGVHHRFDTDCVLCEPCEGEYLELNVYDWCSEWAVWQYFFRG